MTWNFDFPVVISDSPVIHSLQRENDMSEITMMNTEYKGLGLTRRPARKTEISDLCDIYNARVDRHNYIECFGDPEESGTLKNLWGVFWAFMMARPCSMLISTETVSVPQERYGQTVTTQAPLWVAVLDRRKNHDLFASDLSSRKLYMDPEQLQPTRVWVRGRDGESAFAKWLAVTHPIANRAFWSDWSAMPEETDLKRYGLERGHIQPKAITVTRFQ